MDMNKREMQEHERFEKLYKQWGKERAQESGKGFATTPEKEEKISDNIKKYAGPLIAEFYEFAEDFNPILGAAAMLWNYSLFEHLAPFNKHRTEIENELIRYFDQPTFLLGPAEAMNLIQEMKKYWLEEFKHERRIVVDYKISHGEQGVHFSIISEDASPLEENTQSENKHG